MAHRDFDNFKQRLREWMGSHPAEYDRFEAEMNRKDDAGYQMVLAQAMALVPEYEAILRKRINQGPNEDISNIKQLFVDNNLAETLIGAHNNSYQ